MTGFVTFEISGDRLDFDDISDNLRIQPTNIYKKGDTSDKYGLVVQSTDRWIYEVELGVNQNLNYVLKSFITTLSSEENYFKKMCRVNSAKLWCDMFFDFAQFGFVLNCETMSELSQLGLNIEFHCYSHGDIRKD